MPTTKYKTLRRELPDRNDIGRLSEVGEVDANGGEQAIRKQLAVEGFALREGQTLVAIPVSNWTEKGAKVKTTTSFELTEPGESPGTSTAAGSTPSNEARTLIEDALST